MIDVSSEQLATEAEIDRLFDKKPDIMMGEYVRGSDRYVALGTFIDITGRSYAIKAKEGEQMFDAFELERPLAWWVVVIKIQPHNNKIMISHPEIVRQDEFIKSFVSV